MPFHHFEQIYVSFFWDIACKVSAVFTKIVSDHLEMKLHKPEELDFCCMTFFLNLFPGKDGRQEVRHLGILIKSFPHWRSTFKAK